MSETVSILKAARERLSDPAQWSHGHGDGSTICVGIALSDAGDSRSGYLAHRAVVQAFGGNAKGLYVRRVHAWNDSPERTHADVLAALDKAIEAEQA